jgi:hypothetical protein
MDKALDTPPRLDSEPPSRSPVGQAPVANELGWFPWIAVSTAIGLALCTVADALARSTRSSSQVPFWLGLLFIVVPTGFRVCGVEVRRTERISLVLLLGLALYLVKVVHDPFGFTFGDEFVHVHNADEIVRTHSLFGQNSILPVTARYPGLESIAAALSATSGLGTFGAGLIVIGVARGVIMLGLYLLFERLSQSARVAALATVIYTVNANFLFFSAQFSYESLALPLLAVVLFAVAEHRVAADRLRYAWVVPILLCTMAIVITHHLTSYALIVVLVALAIASGPLATRSRRSFLAFALFAAVATAAWLVVVASGTVGYLTPILSSAFRSTIHTLSGEAAPRHLFGSQGASQLEHAVGVGSILVLAVGLPFGLRVAWRRYRSDPFVRLFSVAAVVFFGVLLLRFAPGAWETANRSSEFLFIGLAFILALTGLDRFAPRRAPWLGSALTALFLALVFCGGVMAGWPASLRLSQPYSIDADWDVVEPEGLALARWAASRLPPTSRVAAPHADARLLMVYGNLYSVSASDYTVNRVLTEPKLQAWELAFLRRHHLRYVTLDRRRRSFDNLAGYFFGRRLGSGGADKLLSSRVARKFDRIPADRVYDSGSIVVYDLGQSGATPKR